MALHFPPSSHFSSPHNDDPSVTFLDLFGNTKGQTASNLTPLLSGQFYDQEVLNEERWRTSTYVNPEVKNEDWIWSWAQRQGYVTLLGSDVCGEMFGCSKWNKVGLDHVAPVVESNCNYIYKQDRSSGEGTCVLGKYVHEYYQEYVLDFMEKYEHLPKFSFLHLSEGHVNNPWAVNILDHSTVNFVKRVVAHPNTVLVVSSDHGKGGGHQLPLVSLTFPRNYFTGGGGSGGDSGDDLLVDEDVYTLYKNQDELISWFDVYATLKNVVAFPSNPKEFLTQPNKRAPRSQSLFLPINSTRTCSSIGLPVSDCLCMDWQALSIQYFHNFLPIALIYLSEYLNNLVDVKDIHGCYSPLSPNISSIHFSILGKKTHYSVMFTLERSSLTYRAVLEKLGHGCVDKSCGFQGSCNNYNILPSFLPYSYPPKMEIISFLATFLKSNFGKCLGGLQVILKIYLFGIPKKTIGWGFTKIWF
eukprot:TRINITY_DN12311_c0_g4_i3.p1 TRINITY_DN12311_c0_g4~~TRINITY_DN12311_c0_g4_i3.p1  ORF type:complete len:471 (+),score=86.99 TRINITY_DN12311_c0_g4_i3:855-2267(+)